MIAHNMDLFSDILHEAQLLYASAFVQYTENRAKGQFEKAKIAICNARAFAAFVRSAKRNLAREQERVARLMADCRTCPECLNGAA